MNITPQNIDVAQARAVYYYPTVPVCVHPSLGVGWAQKAERQFWSSSSFSLYSLSFLQTQNESKNFDSYTFFKLDHCITYSGF